MFRLAQARARILGQILVDFQAWLLTMVFYFTVMVPFGIGMRLLGDPLQTKGAVQWLQREPVGASMEEARRQG